MTCGHVSPNGFVCTLEPEHEGQHRAPNDMNASWPNCQYCDSLRQQLAQAQQETRKARARIEALRMGPSSFDVHTTNRHVCGLSGYNPAIDPICPACIEGDAMVAQTKIREATERAELAESRLSALTQERDALKAQR